MEKQIEDEEDELEAVYQEIYRGEQEEADLRDKEIHDIE